MAKENSKKIIIKDIELAYDLESVRNREFQIPLNKVTVIEGASGKGKTSLLSILLGITPFIKGSISNNSDNYSAVFQEDRLIEKLDGIKNIKVINSKLEDSYIVKELEYLLPDQYIKKPVSVYSRGMKRRVAIVRAMLKDSEIVVMDEPFSGLDNELKIKTADYIMKKLNGRTLIIAVHEKKEAECFAPDNIISL